MRDTTFHSFESQQGSYNRGFDINYLDIITIQNMYKDQLNYEKVQHLYVMESGMSMTKELILGKINVDIDVLKFFC